jgi:hypothetical protein
MDTGEGKGKKETVRIGFIRVDPVDELETFLAEQEKERQDFEK